MKTGHLKSGRKSGLLLQSPENRLLQPNLAVRPKIAEHRYMPHENGPKIGSLAAEPAIVASFEVQLKSGCLTEPVPRYMPHENGPKIGSPASEPAIVASAAKFSWSGQNQAV
jgi:hypothetical protein